MRDADGQLQRKLGAVRDVKGHHVFFYLEIEGRERLVAKMSHSWRGQLDKTQIKMMATSMRLHVPEFEGFVECTESAAQVTEKFMIRPAAWSR